MSLFCLPAHPSVPLCFMALITHVKGMLQTKRFTTLPVKEPVVYGRVQKKSGKQCETDWMARQPFIKNVFTGQIRSLPGRIPHERGPHQTHAHTNRFMCTQSHTYSRGEILALTLNCTLCRCSGASGKIWQHLFLPPHFQHGSIPLPEHSLSNTQLPFCALHNANTS